MIRKSPPQLKPHLSKIRTISGFIVGFVPYGFCGALMSIAAPYAWYEGGAVGLRETVRDGLENLNITEERLAELGMSDFTPPLKVTCADHEGNHAVRIQQWDGEKWSFVSDWITPMKDVVRPMIEASAAQYAKEHGITPRDCTS